MDAAGYIEQARASYEAGDPAKAIEFCVQATRLDPEQITYKEFLVEILGTLQLKTFVPQIKDLVTQCLQVDGVDHQRLMLLWFSLFKTDPEYAEFYKAGVKRKYKDFKKTFRRMKNHEALTQPFFMCALQHFIVSNLDFESALTNMRRFFLKEGDEASKIFGGNLDDITAALALYCYRTEYVLFVTEEESERLGALKNNGVSGALLASCYAPFHDLPAAAEMAAQVKGSAILAAFIKTQYTDHKKQQDIKKEIPALTKIAQDISQEVRAQYEGFPYPRWKTLKSSVSLEKLEDFLSKDVVAGLTNKDSQILIAGCGTGYQALEYGMAFPDAQILAVDLSLSSLSYAVQKQRERGIDNVSFKQADILELKEPQGHYDLIISTGVLHHMKDPLAGWSVLTTLLKTGGLMRIALYSELARQFIVRGREIIAREGYGDDAAGIRQFRQDAARLFDKADMDLVANSLDFYAMSECRDMLFHVQEHRYDIPRLRRELDTLGLDLMKFEMPPAWKNLYLQSYPDDPSGENLDYWHEFEQKNPLVFLQMYRFWCRK